MSAFLNGDHSCILVRLETHCAGQHCCRKRKSLGIFCAGGMAAQQPSSGQNDGLLSTLSKQVDALCGAYTEKMRQLHSMLDMEEDSRERTARQTAAGRALWDHVIHDPLARFLAGESQLRKLQGKMEEAAGSRETAGVMLAVRTLWFDGKIEAALQQWREGADFSNHARPQVVLLGAGMDTQAYRMKCLEGCAVFEVDLSNAICYVIDVCGVVWWLARMDTRAYRMKCLEGCAVFEVDLPKIVAFKSALLKCATGTQNTGLTNVEHVLTECSTRREEVAELEPYAASVERVAADLATDEWWDKLREAGFKAGEYSAAPTIWVLEGLLYYLKDAEARALLRQISTSCVTGTLVLADFMNEFSTHLSNELQTQFYFHSDWPEELLPTLGYVCVRVSQMGDPDAHFGLINDNPLSLFHRLRHTPRYCKLAPDGSPCRRLFLVQCSVA